MRAEAPRPEPDIERQGLAADIDGRRDMANAILADQSGVDHGKAAQGHQPMTVWNLPYTSRPAWRTPADMTGLSVAEEPVATP